MTDPAGEPGPEPATPVLNAIWEYARHGHRLLGVTIDPAGARSVARRFRLALVWLGAGTLLGAVRPVWGVVVIAAFIPYYWLPISGELGHAGGLLGGRITGRLGRRQKPEGTS